MKKTLSALALAASLSLSALPAAMAIDNSNFATNREQAQTVASFQVTKDGDPEGDCTATAISPQWAVTAHHCVQEATEYGGKLRLGEEGNYKYYDVDYWESAKDGSDLALVHTSQKMELDHYAEVDDKPLTPGEGVLYGWSPGGMGKTGKLPEAKLSVTQEELSESGLNGDSSGESPILFTNIPGQATIQPGDSGGPFFKDNKVATVTTGSTADTPGAQAVLTPVANHHSWIQERIAHEPTDQEKVQELEENKKRQESMSAVEGAEGRDEEGDAVESSEQAEETQQAQAASSTETPSSTPWIVGGVLTVLILAGSIAFARMRQQK